MKRFSLLLALMMLLSLLAACGQHEHEWIDATCTEPETCATCGETRGEPLGHRWKSGSCTEPETCLRCGETRGTSGSHDWLPATCDKPETCSVCGATQGEALGHDWLGASCEAPDTCSRCGATQGEPLGHDAQPADYWTASVCSRCGQELAPALTPDFVTYGLDRYFMEVGKAYNYRTICYENNDYYTNARATVTDYTIVPSADGLEAKGGYEWRIVNMIVVFDDSNANDYGMSVGRSDENYYDIRLHDDTLFYDTDNSHTYDVLWKGQTYSCRMVMNASFDEWVASSCTYHCRFAAQVPVGYDGTVVGLINRGVEWPDGAYCFDIDNSDTLYFRMS